MRRNYSKFIVVLFIGALLLIWNGGVLFSLVDIEKNASSGNTRSYTDLTGRVVGSDLPENGLPSANVTLMGEVTYNAITDEAGYFNLYSVATEKEYQIRVTIEGYVSLVEDIYIREGDTDLGVLLLLENAYPPNRLIATQNSDDSQVILNWGMPIPVTHYFYDFEGGESGWTSGVISGVDQWECGPPNQSNISSAYSGQNAFMTRLSLPYDNQVNVWLQSPEFNFSFFSEPYLSVSLNIYCENNFDAMILESSIDGGRSWEKVEGDDGFYNNRSSLGPLRGPKWSGRIGVWEEYSTSLPDLANEPSVYLRFRFQSDESIAYEGVAIDDFKIIDQSLRGRGSDTALHSSERGFEEFLVYRFLYDELDNIEEWSTLGTVSDTTFIDEEWSAIENGYYGYGVRAFYTNGVTSEPAFSNWVAKGYTGVAYVHLSVDSGDSGEGSLVELTYLDETPDGKPLSYSGITQGGHPSIAEFRNILLGRYSVRATKAGFEPYIIDEVVVNDQSVIEVEIQELPLPPRRLVAGASNNVVNLSWQPPIPDNNSNLFHNESRALLGYNVYRDEVLITQTPITETTYKDSEVENGREYSYYVTALYSLAESEGSNQVTATPGANQTIRIGKATEKDYTLPLNFWYKNSVTQTIYYKDEINNGGVLEKICYFYDFTSEIINTPIKVWMAEDNISTLSNEWLPSSEMVLVYDGGIDIAPGEGWLEIVLDRYFFYSGSGNLVVMIQRPMDIDFYASTDRFYYSITEDYPYRSRNIHSDDEVFNPDDIIGGTLSSRVPYTELFMITSGMGSISGYVTDEFSNPLAGVIITVDGSEFQAKSDESGYYEFKYIKGGLHKVKGVKFGYYDVVIENVDVVEDQDSKVNFGMSTIKRVSLNGRVVGSDWPEVGLEGAIVRLMGYQDYEAVTDTDGNFEIAEVYSGRSYNVEVERGGYVEIYFELEVEDGDILLEDIVLLEKALPPTNIYAEIIDDNRSVKISWNEPTYRSNSLKESVSNKVGFRGLSNDGLATKGARVRGERALLGYIVHRLKPGEEDKPHKWQELGTVYETGFVDEGWGSLENGAYRYGVVSIFSNNQLSESAFSNQVVYREEIKGICNLQAVVVGQRVDLSWEWEAEEFNSLNDEEGYSVRDGERTFIGFQITRGLKTVAEGLTETEYRDYNVPAGEYTYSIVGMYTNGVTQVLTVDVEVSLSTDNNEITQPLTTTLKQNYPNPFNPDTTINYSLHHEGWVTLEIYNVKGERIRILVDEAKGVGEYSVSWSGDDQTGSRVGSGIYFVRMKSGEYSKLVKMLLLK